MTISKLTAELAKGNSSDSSDHRRKVHATHLGTHATKNLMIKFQYNTDLSLMAPSAGTNFFVSIVHHKKSAPQDDILKFGGRTMVCGLFVE